MWKDELKELVKFIGTLSTNAAIMKKLLERKQAMLIMIHVM